MAHVLELRCCLAVLVLTFACSASSDPTMPSPTVAGELGSTTETGAPPQPTAPLIPDAEPSAHASSTLPPAPSAAPPAPSATPSAPLPGEPLPSAVPPSPSAPPAATPPSATLPAPDDENEVPDWAVPETDEPIVEQPTNDGGVEGPTNCNPTLTGVVRDFRAAAEPGGHPDFEAAFASDTELTGIVESELGSDSKPVYALEGPAYHPQFGQLTHGKAEFDQWFRDVEGVNQSTLLELPLTEGEHGIWTYENMEFFPIDDQLFGNNAEYDHNFGFTFELHTEFQFSGSEVFTFTGDDDLWVFINDKLAIDLGGLHPKLTQSVDLGERAEELGLVPGKTYALDLFQAERHTTASRFRIDTNIRFTHCRPIIVR